MKKGGLWVTTSKPFIADPVAESRAVDTSLKVGGTGGLVCSRGLRAQPPAPKHFLQGQRIFLQKSAPVDSWRSNLSNGKCLKYAFDLS